MQEILKKNISFFFLLITIFLLSMGVVNFYSTAYYAVLSLCDKPYFLLKRQLMWAFLGFLSFPFLSLLVSFLKIFFKKKRKQKHIYPLVYLLEKPFFILFFIFFSSFLLILTYIPGISAEINGSRRWLNILGLFTIQPSELVKVSIIFYLAHYFSRDLKQEKDLKYWIKPMIFTIPNILLVFFQNNFSTAFFLFLIVAFMFFVYNFPFKYVIGLILAFILFSFLAIFFQPYRLKRVLAYINPSEYADSASYQINQAHSYIAKANFLGQGLGRGSAKKGSVPELHSDFILVSFIEEMGFLGLSLLCMLYLIWFFFQYLIIHYSKGMYRKNLLLLISITFALELILNISVVSGVIPVTGTPFLFFSQGGTSLLVTLFLSAIIYTLSKDIQYG